jgi:sulfur relay (sulfurtransferase) DsrF/TusC family protein
MKLKLVILLLITRIVSASPFDITKEEEVQELLDNPPKLVESFLDKEAADLTILDTKTAKKTLVSLKKAEAIQYKDLTLNLEGCWQEKDTFYHKISLAEIRVNNSNYRLSSLNTKLVAEHYLILINCK